MPRGEGQRRRGSPVSGSIIRRGDFGRFRSARSSPTRPTNEPAAVGPSAEGSSPWPTRRSLVGEVFGCQMFVVFFSFFCFLSPVSLFFFIFLLFVFFSFILFLPFLFLYFSSFFSFFIFHLFYFSLSFLSRSLDSLAWYFSCYLYLS